MRRRKYTYEFILSIINEHTSMVEVQGVFLLSDCSMGEIIH